MPPSAHPGRCEVRDVLGVIGDKWTILIVALLAAGPRGFNDLRRNGHGITQRMLSLTLRALRRDGLVARTVHPTVPPRVDYALTDLGRELHGHLAALLGWAETNLEVIRAARATYEHEAV